MAKESSGFVDLGRESTCGPVCCDSGSKKGEKRIYYPSLYISGVKNLKGLSTGEITFTARGKVISVTERNTEKDGCDCSVEIEVHGIKGLSGDGADGGLEEAIEKIASKKSYREEDDE